jgi:energy-coupling factor transporter ATP-binding protein EcfA2
MGQPVSKESRSDRARSDAIDRQISEDSKRYKKECKILLLGSGESGKSTIVKQMKIIHQAGFDARERAEYRTTIYKNVLDSAGTLARVIRRVGLERFEEGEERAYALAVLRAFPPVMGAHVNKRGVGGGDGDSLTTSEEWEGTEDTHAYDGEIEVGVDPVPFTRVEERGKSPYAEYPSLGGDRERYGSLPLPLPSERDRRGIQTERRGIQTGRVSARPGTADGPDTHAVLAQTHAVLTPALADAIWHVARAPAVERLVDEHPAEFYLMDSAS